MESAIASRVLSSRPGSRPMTSARPVTGARPITSTGLMAPKTARARSSVRRQVQDKTYWMGILRAKMNELTMEIALLSKECDQMTKEESRLNMWQRKAESLARELKTATLELAVYNEYWDRLRTGENQEEVLEDINAVRAESLELSDKLESKYKEKKAKEEELINVEKEIQKIELEWASIKRQFTDDQRERFEKLENLNRTLTMEADKLEEKIMTLAERKNRMEEQGSKDKDSIVRKEVLQALGRLRELERQKNDLAHDQTSGDERARLLAQVRRDNKEILVLESRLEEVNRAIEEAKSSLHAYEDSESAEKFRDLKKKEVTINSFLNEFATNLSQETEKMQLLGESIGDLMEKSDQYIHYIETLKGSSESGSEDSKMNLIDEKRKLQLDLSKIDQLETKINSELESLRSRIETLTKDIETYSDLDHLQSEIERRGKSLSEEKKSLEDGIHRLNKERQDLASKVEKQKINLQENDIYKKIKEYEKKLADLASNNEDYENIFRSRDHSCLKKQVFDMINRYNQRLLGF